MAKANMQMPLPTGGKILPKLISALIGVALLVIVVKHPAGAADVFKQAAGAFGSVIEGLWTFIQQLGG
jgi:hypothetical protein